MSLDYFINDIHCHRYVPLRPETLNACDENTTVSNSKTPPTSAEARNGSNHFDLSSVVQSAGSTAVAPAAAAAAAARQGTKPHHHDIILPAPTNEAVGDGGGGLHDRKEDDTMGKDDLDDLSPMIKRFLLDSFQYHSVKRHNSKTKYDRYLRRYAVFHIAIMAKCYNNLFTFGPMV